MSRPFKTSAERMAAIAVSRSETATATQPHHDRRERFRTALHFFTMVFTLVLALAAVLTVETFDALKVRDKALADAGVARSKMLESRAHTEILRKDITDLDARRAQAEKELERHRLRALQAEARERQSAARLQDATGEVKRFRLVGKFYGRVLEACLMTGSTPKAPDARSFEQCMAKVLASDAEFNQLSRADAATMLARAAPPTISLAANPTSVSPSASSTLTWSTTNSSTCAGSGGWSGNKPTAGSQSIGPISSSTIFTLSCLGAGGSAGSSVSVTTVPGGGVAPPQYVANASDSGGGHLDLVAAIVLSVLVVGRRKRARALISK